MSTIGTKKILDLLKSNNITMGIIVSSVIFPLMVSYIKTNWDKANWEQRRITNEIQEKNSITFKKKAEIIDELTKIYVAFLVEARTITFDVSLERQNSDIGSQHLSSYDTYVKLFFKKALNLTFNVGQYFEHSSDFISRFNKLEDLARLLDQAIIYSIEKPVTGKNLNSIKESWTIIENAIDEFDAAVMEILQQLSRQLKESKTATLENDSIRWENEVDEEKLLVVTQS